MNPTGGTDLLVAARGALLDALQGLDQVRDAIVVIGAQAIYLHTGGAAVAVAEATKDSDLAVNPRLLGDTPLLEDAMAAAGFTPDPDSGQPGTWVNGAGVPVDLMVPEALAGDQAKGRRGARIPPHSSRATRRAIGLEAAVVDHRHMIIHALDPTDPRTYTARVAGPAALLVAKLHKIADRRGAPGRLQDKDAHDIYRLLVAIDTARLAEALTALQLDHLAGDVTRSAITYLDELFAVGPTALGSTMAGRAEELVGEPATVSAAAAILAGDVLAGLPGRQVR